MIQIIGYNRMLPHTLARGLSVEEENTLARRERMREREKNRGARRTQKGMERRHTKSDKESNRVHESGRERAQSLIVCVGTGIIAPPLTLPPSLLPSLPPSVPPSGQRGRERIHSSQCELLPAAKAGCQSSNTEARERHPLFGSRQPFQAQVLVLDLP